MGRSGSTMKELVNQKRQFARKLLTPILKYFYETPIVTGGPNSRLQLGERVATANTVFNVSSGQISVGSRSIFSYNVMILTGQHLFNNGKRVSVDPQFDDGSWGGGIDEVPADGFDVSIGEGVFIGAGAIILGGVKIENNCIIGAGAVVTNDVPQFSIVAGVPARIIGDTRK
jgi:maltose O-acetyltransferase